MTNKFGVPLVDGTRGLKMPAMAYRFRVLFGDFHMNELLGMLTQQVMNFTTSLHNNKLKIELRQPVTPGTFGALKVFLKSKSSIYLEPMDGSVNGSTCTIQFQGCECTDHSVRFDYSDSEVVVHHLEFTYAQGLNTLTKRSEIEKGSVPKLRTKRFRLAAYYIIFNTKKKNSDAHY